MAAQLPTGALLQGRYRIIEVIGEGGSGQVYRAERIGTRPIVTVAVKQYSSELGDAAIAQLENEVNALFNLTHPGLPRIYDFFQEGDCWYLVSEYVDGRSVEERLAEGETFSPKAAAELGMQLAELLRYVAERGLVHRDVKPGNMIITPDGQLKLIDFGLAGQAETTELGDHEVFGFSDVVAAPEQKAGLATDVRSDIYSFGAALAYILTQEEPQPTEASKHTRIVDARIGGEMSLILERCLRYEPEDRYQKWDDVCQALNEYAAPLGRGRSRKRRPWASFALGLVAGAAVIGLGLFLYFRAHMVTPPVEPPAPTVPAIVGTLNVELGSTTELSLANVNSGDYRWEFRDTQKPERIMQVLNGTQVEFSPTDLGIFDLTVNGSGLTTPLTAKVAVSQGLSGSPVVSVGSDAWLWPSPTYLGRDKKLAHRFTVTDPKGQVTVADSGSIHVKFDQEGAYQVELATTLTGTGLTTVTVTATQVIQSVKYLIVPAERIGNSNASFESAAADGSPLGWTLSGIYTWDKRNAIEGSRSVRFDTAAAYAMQSIKLARGQKYRVSVWVKGTDLHLNKPAIQLKFRSRYSEQFVRSDIVSTVPLGGTYDWKILIFDFTSPGKVDSNLEINLVYEGTGTIWFDMCALERLD